MIKHKNCCSFRLATSTKLKAIPLICTFRATTSHNQTVAITSTNFQHCLFGCGICCLKMQLQSSDN